MLITPKNFRRDGRALDQGRTIRAHLGQLSNTFIPGKSNDAGAAMFAMGQTRVLAKVCDNMHVRLAVY